MSTIIDVKFCGQLTENELIMDILEPILSSNPSSKNPRMKSRGIIRFVQTFLNAHKGIKHDLIEGAYQFDHKTLIELFGRTEYDLMVKGESPLNMLVYRHKKGVHSAMDNSAMKGKMSAWKMTNPFSEAISNIRQRVSISGSYKRSITDNTDYSKVCAIIEDEAPMPPTDKALVNIPFELKFIDTHDIRFFLASNTNFREEEKLSQFYKECRTGTGRLYGVTGAHIQNKPREFRADICKGQYQVDAEACAQTILSQEYTKQTGKSLVYLNQMIDNKSSVRASIALDVFGIVTSDTIKLVKSSIMPIVFGGEVHTFKTKKTDYKQDFMVVMGYSSFEAVEAINRLKAHHLYSGLVDDMNAIFEELDCIGCPSHRKTRSEQVAWFYQSRETMIMDVVKHYIGFDNIQLSVHDGIIIKESINTDHLSSIVQSKTGYFIKFEQDLL